MSSNDNPYIPSRVRIEKVTVENDEKDLKTFRLAFCEKADEAKFLYACGQFAMLSLPGTGEIPIGIASSPLDKGFVEFTVKRYPAGLVTAALHDLSEGDFMGVRGPLGNGFPLDALKGKNIVIIGGGFAFTTLRATIRYLLHDSVRKDYGAITIVYGARSPGELLYKQELLQWQERTDVATHITVDKGDASWKGREGFVPVVVSQVAPSPANAHCIVCGPPIMLKFTMPPLLNLGFSPETIITSQERRMSCGIGKCGRCNIGSKYVCKDGPVFTLAQMLELEKQGS
jgi:sulfhydrogenase subunit gamma (sulfur reductase)